MIFYKPHATWVAKSHALANTKSASGGSGTSCPHMTKCKQNMAACFLIEKTLSFEKGVGRGSLTFAGK